MAPLTATETRPLHRDQFTAIVVANLPLCREHFRVVLQLDCFPPTEPGQFIQIACRDIAADYSAETEMNWQPGQPPLGLEGRELMSPMAMLRRPFSLAGRRDSGGHVELDVIHRVVGVGTQWLAQLHPGDEVDILGPLGNRFTLPRPGIQAILVGGGVGIPPMLYLAEKLAGRNAIAFCGALTRDLLPLTIAPGTANPGGDAVEPQAYITEFARHGIPSVISTDDGSWGFRGFVTQALERFLDDKPDAEAVGDAPGYYVREEPGASATPSALGLTLNRIIYTCGPEMMMKRVAEIAAARGIECQVAVERAMACGMGTCQSCCIRLRRDPKRDGRAFAGKDWIYKLACTDGPIFKGSELLW